MAETHLTCYQMLWLDRAQIVHVARWKMTGFDRFLDLKKLKIQTAEYMKIRLSGNNPMNEAPMPVSRFPKTNPMDGIVNG